MDIKEIYERFKESSGVTTDSRAIKGGEMFVALRGENFDGNEYAMKALEAGAKYAVVNESSPVAALDDPRLVRVPDTLLALKDLACYHRENTFVEGKRLTVIGLTGTNGKTTTKNLISAVLSGKYVVTATEGNLNNDIGVPLSLLKISPETQLAVIEMGANHPDDIKNLVSVCEPDYGLVTNVGKGHLLGFGNFEGVKRAKGQLYDYVSAHGGKAFLNVDDPVLVEMASEREGLETIPYGVAKVLPSSAAEPYLRMELPGGEIVKTHLVGKYNSGNVMAALAVGTYFGVPLSEAVSAVGEYVPTNNRSQMERTARNVLIEDYYNANPSSVKAALDNLSCVEAQRKVVMLGDMRELGDESVAEHVKILETLASMDLDGVFLVGGEFRKALDESGLLPSASRFADSEALASYLGENPVCGATILVKGSRGIMMEKVVPKL